MIESIQFENFKVLKDATLKLRPFNIIVGPNGSGKSTVFQALEAVQNPHGFQFRKLVTAGENRPVEVGLKWQSDRGPISARISWATSSAVQSAFGLSGVVNSDPKLIQEVQSVLSAVRIFAFEPSKIAEAIHLQPDMQLAKDGSNLAGALDSLRDKDEDAFNALKEELRNWLPEYETIIFETPNQGHRSFKLRQTFGKQTISSKDLSEGTLVALALLLIAHNPNPPALVCLEDPDKGLHPRLLRDVRGALYRLSYPEKFGLKRKPVQVIATTHSPLFLDLFKEHPEDIIIAEKHSDGTATFKSLAEDAQLREMIGDASLGEVWYSGLLGGVPALK